MLQQCTACFALTEVEKRKLVENAETLAGKYAAAAADYLNKHSYLETSLSYPISAYEILRDRLSGSAVQILLQSEAPAANRRHCNERRPSAIYIGSALVVCDAGFLKIQDLGSELAGNILHEEAHGVQAQDLGGLNGGIDQECLASEMAGVVMLLSKQYAVENDYTIDRRCNKAVSVFRTVHSDLKNTSTQLAPGQFLAVDPKLGVTDLKVTPATYLQFDTTNAEVVKKLKKADRWRIVEVSPADLYGDLESRGTTAQATKIILRDAESSLETVLTLTSEGLNIYTDDFEAAFSRKITISSRD
jgi:hypothetical protein